MDEDSKVLICWKAWISEPLPSIDRSEEFRNRPPEKVWTPEELAASRIKIDAMLAESKRTIAENMQQREAIGRENRQQRRWGISA